MTMLLSVLGLVRRIVEDYDRCHSLVMGLARYADGIDQATLEVQLGRFHQMGREWFQAHLATPLGYLTEFESARADLLAELDRQQAILADHEQAVRQVQARLAAIPEGEPDRELLARRVHEAVETREGFRTGIRELTLRATQSVEGLLGQARIGLTAYMTVAVRIWSQYVAEELLESTRQTVGRAQSVIGTVESFAKLIERIEATTGQPLAVARPRLVNEPAWQTIARLPGVEWGVSGSA